MVLLGLYILFDLLGDHKFLLELIQFLSVIISLKLNKTPKIIIMPIPRNSTPNPKINMLAIKFAIVIITLSFLS